MAPPAFHAELGHRCQVNAADMAVVGVGNVLRLRRDDHLRPSGPRWGEVFGGTVVAAVMIDRLVHLARVISLKEDSPRINPRSRLRPTGHYVPGETSDRLPGPGPHS